MRAIALAVWLVGLGAGCEFHSAPTSSLSGSGGGDDDAGVPADAYVPVDGPPLDSKAPAICLGTFPQICVDPPTTDVSITQNLDTSTAACSPFTSTAPLDACVIAGKSITIDGGRKISVTGNKKLVLFAATGAITISGTLDAASHSGQSGGPAADIGPCTKGTDAKPAQGGGYGGSFGGAGNNGGTGANGNGVGGIAAPAITADALRGGCPGSDGQGQGGNRGRGGGAAYLLAKTIITIDGTVNASGAGGDAGIAGGGAGGGGSGGMIVLEAPTVNVPGKCFANGGGGGGGASGLVPGRAGGESAAPASKPAGGMGGTTNGGGFGGAGTGGNGGDGAYQPAGSLPGTTGGGNGAAQGAGGGAGGGLGVIKIFATETHNVDSSHVWPQPN